MLSLIYPGDLILKSFFNWLLSLFFTTTPNLDSQKLREMELKYLEAAVAVELLDFSHIEIPALENIKIVQHNQENYLGLRTYHGQPLKNKGVRAEVSIDYPYMPEETLTYSWSFLIEKDFPSDAPLNRWWLFADWHDQPHRTKNEGWDGFPSRSPPVAIGYGIIDNKDALALVYGSPDSRTIGTVNFSRGQWHRVSVQITWSQHKKGQIKLYLDNSTQPVLSAVGANMHNDFQHYLKVGSYRHPDIKGDAWVYIRDIQIKKSIP